MTLNVRDSRRGPSNTRLGIAGSAVMLVLGALLGAAAARAAGASALLAAPAYTLDNSAKAFSMQDIEKTAAGYQYWFFDKAFAEGRTIKLSVVGPHQRSHAPHQHEGHEFFFVLSGKAEFFLDGKTRVVGPQTALYCPPGVMHGIANAGDSELQYLVIKDYPWPAQAAPGSRARQAASLEAAGAKR
jgi:mannose-6-phosphate isomerase-like protein (cupin superfamily)